MRLASRQLRIASRSRDMAHDAGPAAHDDRPYSRGHNAPSLGGPAAPAARARDASPPAARPPAAAKTAPGASPAPAAGRACSPAAWPGGVGAGACDPSRALTPPRPTATDAPRAVHAQERPRALPPPPVLSGHAASLTPY